MENREKGSVLIASDRQQLRECILKYAERQFVNNVFTIEQMQSSLQNKTTDLLILDTAIFGGKTQELLQKIKQENEYISIICIVDKEDVEMEKMAFKSGAVEVWKFPMEPEVLCIRMQYLIHGIRMGKKLREFELQKKIETERYRKMAYLDPLTAMWNRRYLENQVNEYLSEEDPKGYFLILDVDDFKEINDLGGHIEGDRVLVRLGEVLKRAQSNSILSARLAGDEFVVFIKNIEDGEYAELLAKSVMIEISGINTIYGTQVTVSMGISKVMGKGDDFLHLYGRADKALYEAKSLGKASYRFCNKNRLVSEKVS